MRFLARTGLATGVVVAVLVLVSVCWAEYSARDSCAGAGSAGAPLKTVAEGAPATLIDQVLPEYQIGEKHSIFVEAPPDRVFASLKRAGGYERPVVRLFGLLPTIVGDENAPLFSQEEPIYEGLTSGSGLVLKVPNRELVLADVGSAGERASSAPHTARGFAAYRLGPGEMKGAVNLRVDPVEGGSRLTTETLMAYGDPASCRGFGRYWGLMYPGSSLLRIELLKTVKHRAESVADPVPSPAHEQPGTAPNGGVAWSIP